MAVPSAFDRDTAVRRAGDSAYEASLDPSWNVLRGPNGGYVAAIVLRAMAEELDAPERPPRSLTLYYPSAPVPGPVGLAVRVERSGRSMSTVSARMEQDGRPAAIALAAFSTAWPGAVEFDHTERRAVPDPEEIEPLERPGLTPPFRQHFEFRPAIGDPLMSGSDRALSGGWMRPVEPRPLDALLAASLADAWPPAVFPMARERPFPAPTIELTIYFRAPLPVLGATGEADWVLGRFESRLARDGFFEEEGVIWTRAGEPIVQSRQLALAIAAPPG